MRLSWIRLCWDEIVLDKVAGMRLSRIRLLG